MMDSLCTCPECASERLLKRAAAEEYAAEERERMESKYGDRETPDLESEEGNE